jgi:hypothetical protein
MKFSLVSYRIIPFWQEAFDRFSTRPLLLNRPNSGYFGPLFEMNMNNA